MNDLNIFVEPFNIWVFW